MFQFVVVVTIKVHTLLERPFHKDFNGVCFILGGCILAEIIAFKNVSHDL